MEVESHNPAYVGDSDSIDGLFSKLYSNVSAILNSLSQKSYLVDVAFIAYFFLKFLVWMHTTVLSCAILWCFLYLINMAAESLVEFNEDCVRIVQERNRTTWTTAQALTNDNQMGESIQLYGRARTVPTVKNERVLALDHRTQDNEEIEHTEQAEFETPPTSQESSCTTLTGKITSSRARSMPSNRTKTNFTMKSENIATKNPNQVDG